jgi:hypothetical protein
VNLLLASVVLGYALTGISTASSDLRLSPLNRPAWARNPTPGALLFATLTWWAGPIVNDRITARSIAFGGVAALTKWGGVTLVVYVALFAARHFADGSVWRAVLAILFLVVGSFTILPLYAIVSIPITLLIAWPLDRLFPDRRGE